MEFERPMTYLTGLKQCNNSTDNLDMCNKASKAEYQKEMYTNTFLATPILQPVKGKVHIPPLDGFPKPAIPVESDSIFNLASDSK